MNQPNLKLNKLFTAILEVKTIDEAQKFFRDLCTIDELNSLAERWEIVLLLDKKISYREIAEKLQVSTTTVSRVANWLNNGTGGYQLILNRLNNHHNSSNIRKKS